jgi:hypothetical protein
LHRAVGIGHSDPSRSTGGPFGPCGGFLLGELPLESFDPGRLINEFLGDPIASFVAVELIFFGVDAIGFVEYLQGEGLQFVAG